MKKKIIGLIVVSIILIIAMIFIADPRKLFNILSKVNLQIIIYVVLLYLINIVFKAFRWHLLINSSGKSVSFSKNISFLMIGLMVNNTTPGRIAGEPVRVHLLNSRANVSVGRGLATIFAERIMDLIILTTMALIGLIFILPLIPSSDIQILLIPFFVNIFNRITKDKWSDKLEKSRESFTSSFKKGFNEILKTKKYGILCMFLTVLIWLNEAFRIYLILLALPGVSVSSFGSVLIASSAATLFGIALPGGALNAALIAMVFTATGIEVASATTAGILAIMTSIWLSVPLGIIAMFIVGLKIDKLAKKKQGRMN